MKSILLAMALGATLAAQAPLPTALRDAKTVYLVNKGVHPKAVEHAIETLTKWKRWTLVADAQAADITLTLSPQPTKAIYNWALNQSVTVNSNFLEITGPDGTPLYGAVFTGWPDKTLQKLAKELDAK